MAIGCDEGSGTRPKVPQAIFGLVDKLRPSVVESVSAQLGIQADHAVGVCTPKSKANFVHAVQENRQSASARQSKRAPNVMFVGIIWLADYIDEVRGHIVLLRFALKPA